MVVDGTGGAGSKWIKTSYPEIPYEELNLVADESHATKGMKEGIEG